MFHRGSLGDLGIDIVKYIVPQSNSPLRRGSCELVKWTGRLWRINDVVLAYSINPNSRPRSTALACLSTLSLAYMLLM